MPDPSPLIALDQAPPDAARLFEQAEQVYPEWGLDWFQLLARHALPPNQRAGFISAHAPGEDGVSALLPLMFDTANNRLSGLSTFYTSLFTPVYEPTYASQTLNSIFHTLKQAAWPNLKLAPMSRDDSLFATTLDSLREAGWRAYPYFCFGNWYQTTAGLSFDAYFRNRPSQVRNTVNRRKKKFLADGRGRLELVNSDDIERAIRVWTEIYNASWKIPEPFPDFMPELIRLCAHKGWLRMAIAFYDDTPIAAQIWIVHQGRAAIYKLAYDEKYAEHSAGTLLTAFLMQHVLDVDQVDEVDYLIGDEPYKQDWVSARRERWGIVAYNPSTLRGLAGWIREAAGRIVKKRLQPFTKKHQQVGRKSVAPSAV